MENLHEMGHRFRELKKKRVRLAVEVAGLMLLAVLFVWGSTTIDRLEGELAEARSDEREAMSAGRTDTVMIGLKRATLQNGDVVLRIGIVGEERSEDGGWRMEEGKGKAATGGRDSSGNLGMTKGGKK